VFSANIFAGVLNELASEFERTSGHNVTIVYGTIGAIENRVDAGEFADVTILPRRIMDELVRQERVILGSSVDLAHSTVGVAVRTGAPKPDISSVDASRRSTVKLISYSDPTSGAAPGVLFSRVLHRLGIGEDGSAKILSRGMTAATGAESGTTAN
jgi:molybdate transport system substrate-binding protein